MSGMYRQPGIRWVRNDFIFPNPPNAVEHAHIVGNNYCMRDQALINFD